MQGGSYINIINNDEDKNIFQLNNNCMNIIENDKPQGKNLIELEFMTDEQVGLKRESLLNSKLMYLN